MKSVLVFVLVCASAAPVCAGAVNPSTSLDPAVAAAAAVLSADPAVAKAAVAGLRARGPEGLALLASAYRDEIEAVRRGGTAPPDWDRIGAALDAVGAQRDCHASELYWYTDLDAALAAAKATGRPVLSLRLLGRLDEEFSCANSRFFRTALYAHDGVRAALRNGFVLHWSSERPAPRITIDFGDGRRLERTITGNSAHYVLDSSGRVVDVLPGLYGPGAFLRELDAAGRQARSVARFDEQAWRRAQGVYWSGRQRKAESDWRKALTRQRRELTLMDVDPRSDVVMRGEAPAAADAGRLAVTKALAEMPMLKSLDLVSSAADRAADDQVVWSMARASLDDARLDDGGRAMMRRKLEPGEDADVTREQFELLMAVDTVRNRHQIHPRILALLIEMGNQPFDAVNRRVYDDVFLTLASDPWLGLKPAGVYTALEPE